jgi:hypothetical protein
MNDSRVRWLGVILVTGVALASFEYGRRSAIHYLDGSARNAGSMTTGDSRWRLGNGQNGAATFDVQKIGRQTFAEIYPVLRGASAAERAKWAQQVAEMPDGPQKRGALTLFYKILVQINPEQAVELAMQIPSELLRMAASTSMQAVAPYRAMGEIIKLLETFPRDDLSFGDGRNDFTNALQAWSSVEPVAAAKFLDANPDENTAPNRATIVRYWAAYDPSAAKAWLQRILPQDAEATGEVSSATKALMDGWFEYDRSQALDFAVTNQGNSNFADAIGSMARRLIRQSPDLTRDFVDRLTGDAHFYALEGTTGLKLPVADEAPGTPPNRAFSEMEEGSPPSPDALVAWLLTFSPNESDSAIFLLFRQWNQDDRQSLLNYIGQLPKATRGRAVDNYPTPYGSNVEAEVGTLLNLSDVELRDQLLEKLMPDFFHSRDEVIDLLQRSSLSPAQKSHLQSLIPEKDPDPSAEPEEIP